MIRRDMLSVWANPWHALDHFGRPAGHVAKEREASTPGHAGYVGCEIVASAPEVLEPGSAATPDQDTCWHFSKDPVTVPNTQHYRNAVRNGELFAADERVAKKCGVKFADLVPALEASKKAAYGKWKACFGEEPEDVDPYDRPMPAGVTSPMDVAAKSGADRAEAAHKQAEAAAEKLEAAAKADQTDPKPRRRSPKESQ